MTSAPLHQIHDLAANYSDRQGLRVVPMAIMVLIQSVPRPLTLRSWVFGWAVPLSIFVIGIGGYWLIGRYYERRFGRVEELPYEGVPVAAQAVVVLGCVILTMVADVVLRPPVFLSGLVVAGWLIVVSWPSHRIRGFYFAAGVVLALVSLLPALGLTRNQVCSMYGIVFSVTLLLAGIRDHLEFVRFFAPAEPDDE